MIRHVFERGLSSLMARWMLDGSADALFERIAQAHAMKPEELEKLRAETRAYLEKVRDEGAPYADTVMAAVRELLRHAPDVSGITSGASKIAMTVAARSAEHAAARAQDLAERLRQMQEAGGKPPKVDPAGPEDGKERP